MRTANSTSQVEGKPVFKENPHDLHDYGLEEAKIQLSEIIAKKADDTNHMVNLSEHEEPLSPLACIVSNVLLDGYILTILGFLKEIDITSLKTSLQNNLAEHQRFSSILVKDKKNNNLKWCLREVVIEDHVIVPSLSPSLAENPNFVKEYASSLVTSPPLNPCRPLWEVHVLNIPSEDAAASLVFRIHHSLGDCISMLSLLVNSAPPPPIPQRTVLAEEKFKPFLQIVYSMIVALWVTFLFLIEVGITFLWKHDKNLLRGRASKTSVCSKRLAYVTLSMDDISMVRKAVNGTLNEVIMGALSAGLVRYMSRSQQNGKSISVPQKETTLKNSRLRAMVAVNMRKSNILKDLDRNMKCPSKVMWGNKLGFWMFPLPMLHYDDPLQYCRDTTLMSRRKKLSFEAAISYAIANHMPTKLVALFCKRFTTILTVGFSNVMGPAEEIQYGDNLVTHIIPTAHINNCHVLIHFMSYGGKGKLVALVLENVVPDPLQLCQDCADALQLMKETAHATSIHSS